MSVKDCKAMNMKQTAEIDDIANLHDSLTAHSFINESQFSERIPVPKYNAEAIQEANGYRNVLIQDSKDPISVNTASNDRLLWQSSMP